MSTDPFSSPKEDAAGQGAAGQGAAGESSADKSGSDFAHIPFSAYRPGIEADAVPATPANIPRPPAAAAGQTASDPPASPVPTLESAAPQPTAPEPLIGDLSTAPRTSTPDSRPDIVDDVEHALDPRSITLGRIGSMIGTFILSGLLGFAAVIVSASVSGSWPIALMAWSGLSLLLAIRAWVWPGLSYRYMSYRLNDRGLVIRRGVLWRSVAHVPRSRVQHTDVSQGPLERYFELGTLTVHTAGTQFASVSLDGLAHETARQIRDVLIEAGEGDGV